MESSNSELNRTTSAPVRHEQKTAKLNTFSSEKIQCPSQSTHSSSSSSSSDDQHIVVPNASPTVDDDNNDETIVVPDASPTETPRTQEMEQTPSTYRTTSTPVKREHETSSTRLKKFSSEKISCPSSPTQSSSSPDNQTSIVLEESPTEAPRTQEMERTPSSYRIPPSVFERSPTSSPMEWSTASNESLFSIHMGNMSFTNDHFLMGNTSFTNDQFMGNKSFTNEQFMGNKSFTNDQFQMGNTSFTNDTWRSEEMTPPAEASTSEQMFSYGSGGGSVSEGDMRVHEMGLAEATMLEVIKESENQNPTKPFAEVRNARRSEGSNTSNKSFAFSMMGVETGSSTRMHGSIKSNHEQPQTPKQPPEPENPIESENQAQSSWFSCFSCCPVSK